jgi:hypothetical protein
LRAFIGALVPIDQPSFKQIIEKKKSFALPIEGFTVRTGGFRRHTGGSSTPASGAY